MGELYLRKVVLDIFPKVGKSKRISDLRIKFKCGKLNKSKINDASIQVFNLSDDTRKLIQNKTTRVALSVGYLGLTKKDETGKTLPQEDSVEQIFIGNVTKIIHKVQPPDIITDIKIGDGDNHYRNSKHTKGYPPNTKLKDVISDLTNAMQLNKGPQEGIPDKNFPHGITLSGLAKDHLNNLTQSNNLQWSIQDETLQVIPQNGHTTDSVIIIGPDSGLVGSPDRTLNGVEFSCLIQPKLKPGRRVQLKSHFIEGEFIVKKVEHDGDSFSGNFLSKVQAVTK